MLASKGASWKSLLSAGAALVLKFKDDLEFRAVKTSRRDLAMVVSKRLHGGTTVSGTMLVSVSEISERVSLRGGLPRLLVWLGLKFL